MVQRTALAGILFLGLLAGPALAQQAAAASRTPPAGAGEAHAIAMHGAPAYPAGFSHFSYVNPAAPKGGQLTLSAPGTFDSLNPFVVRGSPTPVIRTYVVESLMARGYDEPFTLYPLLAAGVETDEARSFVTFRMDPRARFSDGTPVTTADVAFSFELLKTKGRPNHRLYYGKVSRVERPDAARIRFVFETPDRELPLIMGLMPVFSRHATDPQAFAEGGLSPPIGSGPYVVEAISPGASITLARNPAYWGADLPANAGLYNFDRIRVDYFRDANTEFEAFRRHLVDARFESDPTRWETGYDFAAVRSGAVIREVIPTGLPKPHFALVFNTRRPLFADVRVRRAILELFDFPWIDRTFYHGLYTRSVGYFDGSDLSAVGVPANAAERGLLAPFPDAVRPDVLEGTYTPPPSDGSGRDRTRLKAALGLLETAGWRLRDGALVDEAGRPFGFEIMVNTREQERLCIAFASQLARAGITARVRIVDAVQFDARRNAFDFDMVPFSWGQSLSPGSEQGFYFGSAAADSRGSRNYMGMRNHAADALTAALVAADDRSQLVAAARALDRVLISGTYDVPLFYAPGQWLARWRTIQRPATPSLYGTLPETWWRAQP